MAGNGWIRSTLISMLATPSLLAPALAQDAKSVADNAALCHVALSLKAGEATLAPADSVRYRRVADWFSLRGAADNSESFTDRAGEPGRRGRAPLPVRDGVAHRFW